jgi:glycosyltransferase involved in cell wall biosynthesis
VILRRLLDYFPPDSYAVLTDSLAAFAGSPRGGWLPAPYHFHGSVQPYSSDEALAAVDRLSVNSSVGLSHLLDRLARPAMDVGDVAVKARSVGREATRVIASEGADLVLATSGDPVFLVAAADAARVTRRPFFVHLFDLVAGNRYSPAKRWLAANSEIRVLRQAEKVFVANESMAAYYRKRADIAPEVVPNGIDIPTFRPAKATVATPPTVLYTGAVYWAQRDSVRDLVLAMRRLPQVKLDIRTRASSAALLRVGLGKEIVSAGFGSQEEAMAAQRDADLLFLPLSFRGPAREVIRTALPGKTAEYLVSGTPILVHAPPDAYMSQYARERGWGYVVDKPEPGALVAAIQRLLGDADLRARLVDAAYHEAVRTHDMQKIGPAYAKHFA